MYHVLKTLMTYTNWIYMIKLTINIIIFRCKGFILSDISLVNFVCRKPCLRRTDRHGQSLFKRTPQGMSNTVLKVDNRELSVIKLIIYFHFNSPVSITSIKSGSSPWSVVIHCTTHASGYDPIGYCQGEHCFVSNQKAIYCWNIANKNQESRA